MRVSKAELKDIAFYFNLITYTHQLLLYGVSLRYTYNHVIDKRAVQTMQRPVTWLISRTGYVNLIPLYGNLNVWINLLLKFSKRAFYANHVIGANRYGYALW